MLFLRDYLCEYRDIEVREMENNMSMRRFHFERAKDVSGISGCGIVACGVLFDDGQVAVHWTGAHSSINIYKSMDDVIYVHGHDGCTRIVFDDPEESEEKKANDKN